MESIAIKPSRTDILKHNIIWVLVLLLSPFNSSLALSYQWLATHRMGGYLIYFILVWLPAILFSYLSYKHFMLAKI